MSNATPLAADQSMPTTPDHQVVESWQEVDSLIQRMQSAVRDYAQDLTEYVDAQQDAQEKAAAHVREQMLDELRAQREQMEAAQQTLDTERAAIESDRGELEQRWQEVDRAARELDDRETRLDQQHAAQEETSHKLDQAEARIAADRKQLDQDQASYQSRHDELEARAEDLEERQAALDAAVNQLQQRQGEIEQRAQKVHKKEAEFKQTAERVTAELREQKDKQESALAQTRQEQEAQLTQQREEQEAQLAAHREQAEGELARQRESQQAELAQQRKEQETELAEQRKATEADIQQRTATVTRRERKSNKVEQALDERRAKLHQYKEIIEKRSRQVRADEAEVEPMRKAAEAVLAKRDEVTEAQQSLAQTETAMIRRWGMHRASGLAIAAMALLGVIAGLSYVIGGQVATQTWAATAVVQHQTPLPSTPDAWLAGQQQTIASDATIDRALMTMRQIGYTGPATPQHVRAMIDSGLTLHSPAPGVLHLELHGASQSELAPILGGLVRAMSTDANTSMPRPDVAIVQGATLATTPLTDNHIAKAVQIFFGGAVVSLLVFFGAMFVLLRTRGGQATVLEPIAADAQVWQEHARHLRHNPEAESQADEQTIPVAKPAKKPKASGTRTDATADAPAPDEVAPVDPTPQIVDTDEQADANAETVIGHHPALDFGDAAEPDESAAPPPQPASTPQAAAKPARDNGDLHGAPEFKPL